MFNTNTDVIFLSLTVITGLLYFYYAVTRLNDEGEFRKPVVFWRDLFLLLMAIFVFRGFFWDMRSIPSNSMQRLYTSATACWLRNTNMAIVCRF